MDKNKINCTDSDLVALDHLESHTVKIKKTIELISKEFVRIGFLLWEVREYKWYECKGYKDVVEYANKELGFKRTSTFNFISIVENFSQKIEGKPTQFIDLNYKKYGYTKLTQLLSLSEEERKLVNEDMSVREIKQIKKELKEKKEKKEEDSPTDWTETEINGQLKLEDNKIIEHESSEEVPKTELFEVLVPLNETEIEYLLTLLSEKKEDVTQDYMVNKNIATMLESHLKGRG